MRATSLTKFPFFLVFISSPFFLSAARDFVPVQHWWSLPTRGLRNNLHSVQPYLNFHGQPP
jgi:hypothetical protein